MAKLKINAGTLSKTVKIYVQNYTSSSGAGLTGLTYSSAGLVAYYLREGVAGPGTAIALSAGTSGTWSSGGFIASDASNMPGVYELGLPNAAIASGSQEVLVILYGATNMLPVVLEIELDAVNYQSTTNFIASIPSVTGTVSSNLVEVGGSSLASVGVLQTVDLTALVNSIMTFSIESGVTLEVAIQKMAAVIAGNLVGSSSTAGTYQAVGNPGTTRVTTTISGNNRTSS